MDCHEPLLGQEKYFCLQCKLDLPKTNDHIYRNDDLLKKFASVPQVISATSWLFLQKENMAEKLIYQLKYNGKHHLGHYLGVLYGEELMRDGFEPPDVILPVPLHKSRLRKRGYNQSASFAEGLAVSLGDAPVDHKLIKREKKTKTQTRKTKLQRWMNIEQAFSAPQRQLTAKTALVVDDVITTGATVSQFCEQLVKSGVQRISVVSIARRQ